MNKLLLLLAAVCFAVSCGPKGYTITGSVADSALNGQTVYMTDLTTQKTIDSAVIADRSFEFRGSVADTAAIVWVIGTDQIGPLFVAAENEQITVALGPVLRVHSSGLNGKMGLVADQLSALDQWADRTADSLVSAYGGNADQVPVEEANALGNDFQQAYIKTIDRAIADNADNVVGAFYLLQKIQGVSSLAAFDAAIAAAPSAIRFAPVAQVRAGLVAAEATVAGKPFVDFDGKNLDGTPAKLSDYVGKGKWVVADFWASWCGPCKAEIPNLKFLADTYPDLVVLGVNVWDKEEAFRATLAQLSMTWPQIYASDNTSATDTYGIQGIPTLIVFTPEGVIESRSLRGEELRDRVAEIFPDVKAK